MTRHDLIIEDVVERHHGQIVRPRGEGDSRFAVFASPSEAVAAASAIQAQFTSEHWPTAEPVQVRMAVHTGEADLRLGDYYGPAVNHCARLRAVAHGGQVLVSAITADLVRESLETGISLRDLGTHQLRDLEQPEHIWQLVQPGLALEFPPLASARRTHNLPEQLSSFVGRVDALAELQSLVRNVRLVTLVGPGGIGKTRLALQAAAEIQPLFEDGVWLVRLEALTDSALVPAAVASALGIGEQPATPLVDTLREGIGSSQLLLVLDNCEHLIQICADLTDLLLQWCPRLHILVTSREPLGVPGESLLRVPPLTLPEPQHDISRQQLSEYESIRLFVERAEAAQRGFQITAANAHAIAAVCRQLDGLPLAIELAARRTRSLSAEQIAERLDDRFSLLIGGTRTASRRQQTLQACIDWSYQLLTEPDRALFRRLGVFAGGWTLEAAEAVCGAPEITSDEVVPGTRTQHIRQDTLNTLSSLVDKSLVTVDEQDGIVRYRLLDAIRQYASDSLASSGEADATRQRHAEYFVALAEEADPNLHGADQLSWFRRLDREHDNFRAALDWLLERGSVDLGLRLASGLWFFWYVRCHFREGRERLERALAKSTRPSAARGRALHAAGYLALAMGERQRAMALHEEAVALLDAHGHARDVAMARRGLGRAALQLRDFERATRALEDALAILRELADPWGIAACLHNLGNVAMLRGEDQKAEAFYGEALDLRRRIGDQWGLATSLSNLGVLALRAGEIERAVRFVEQALPIQQELEMPNEIADSLRTLGHAARRRGDLERAAALYEKSLALRRRVGDKPGIALALTNLASVALRQRAYDTAARLLLEALAPQSEPADRIMIAQRFDLLAELAAAVGLRTKAAGLLGTADAVRDSIDSPRSMTAQGEYERVVAGLRASLGDAVFASELAAGRERSLDEAFAGAIEMLHAFLRPAAAPDFESGFPILGSG